MGFSTALSGINTASKDLQVTSNNIANANTTGFKKSRTEFVDIYASSLSSNAGTTVGAGAKVATIAQNFTQGSVDFTDNSMDMAISGQGFFSLSNTKDADRPIMYTRNGEFKLDEQGYVVGNGGEYLMGFQANGTTVEEGFSEGAFSTIQLNATVGGPDATGNIETSVNIDARESLPSGFQTTPASFGGVGGVDPLDPDTYSHVSSVTTFDSLGNAHIASTYFVSSRELPDSVNAAAQVMDSVLGQGDFNAAGATSTAASVATNPLTAPAVVSDVSEDLAVKLLADVAAGVTTTVTDAQTAVSTADGAVTSAATAVTAQLVTQLAAYTAADATLTAPATAKIAADDAVAAASPVDTTDPVAVAAYDALLVTQTTANATLATAVAGAGLTPTEISVLNAVDDAAAAARASLETAEADLQAVKSVELAVLQANDFIADTILSTGNPPSTAEILASPAATALIAGLATTNTPTSGDDVQIGDTFASLIASALTNSGIAANMSVSEAALSDTATISSLSVAVTDRPAYALMSSTAQTTAAAAVVREANVVADVYSASTADKWQAHFFVDGQHIKPDGTLGTSLTAATDPTSKSGLASTDYTELTFDTKGSLATVAGDPLSKTITYTGVALGGANGIDSSIAVDPMTINFDLTGTTNLSSEYAVKDLYQDGIPVGNLTGIDIDNKGVVLARFSNGGFDILGKVVLSRFANNQGMENVGGSIWKETIESGQPIAGQAGTGSFGLIESGALEASNVDLSAELVHLIIAQQTYQANAQSISTEKAIMQTILQA